MTREEALQRVPSITTEALPARVAIKLHSVELLAHAIHWRWPMTLDQAHVLNRAGWPLPYYTEDKNGNVFKRFPGKGDAVYGDGSLREAWELAQEWVSRNE